MENRNAIQAHGSTDFNSCTNPCREGIHGVEPRAGLYQRRRRRRLSAPHRLQQRRARRALGVAPQVVNLKGKIFLKKKNRLRCNLIK